LIEAVDADRDAGVEAACALVDAVADHGGFAGAHVVAVGRYRQVAARLEASGWARTSGRARPTAR
jgi:methylenetetrahydrofolate reductase (NADPH)